MSVIAIPETIKSEMLRFLKKNKKADLITTYLFFLEKKFNLKPVLFIRDKVIYQSRQDLIHRLEEAGKLWRETEIKIQYGQQSVNEQSKKFIYVHLQERCLLIIHILIHKMLSMTGFPSVLKTPRGLVD